jgi:hypothetical protein
MAGWTALLAMLFLVGGAAQPARATVTFEATIEPKEVVFLETFELAYRLRMTTGSRPERFRVRVEQPRWNPASPHDPAGFPAVHDCFRRPLVLHGPGRLADTVCRPSRSRANVCERGGGHVELRADVTLPPHSTSALVARFLTGGPPLPSTDYRATFVVGGSRNDTLPGRQEIQPPEPAVLGPFGTHIVLSTWPRTPYFRFPAGRRLRPGRVINIRGRTESSLRGQRMLLRYRFIPSRGATPLRTLARVEIGPRGRFSYRGWRPRRLGAYRLYAAYRPRSPNRILDESCSRGFAIRR